MTADPKTVEALVDHLITTYCPASSHEDAAATVREWAEEAAVVADGLIEAAVVEAVAAERAKTMSIRAAAARAANLIEPVGDRNCRVAYDDLMAALAGLERDQ